VSLFLLLTYFVSFAEPGEHFRVETFFARNSGLIDVIVGRRIFHARKAWTLDPVLAKRTRA